MDHPAMATTTSIASSIVGGLLLVTLGGCSDATAGSPGADATASTPPGSASASPSTAADTVPSAASATASAAAVTPGLGVHEQQALDTYEGMWDAYAVAAETADHTTDRLAPFATGDALLVLIRGLTEAHEEGVVSRGRPVTNARIEAVTPAENPTRITIIDCLDSTDWLQYRGSTGELVNDVPGGRHETTAALTRANEAWIVTDLQVRGVGTC